MKKLIKKYTATTIMIVSVAITIIMIFAKPAPKPVQVKFIPPMVETLDAIPQTYKVIINSQGTVAPQKEMYRVTFPLQLKFLLKNSKISENLEEPSAKKQKTIENPA